MRERLASSAVTSTNAATRLERFKLRDFHVQATSWPNAGKRSRFRSPMLAGRHGYRRRREGRDSIP